VLCALYFQNDILQADDEVAISNETAEFSKTEVRLCRNCMHMAYKIVLLYLCVWGGCTHTYKHYLSQNNCNQCTDFLSTWYECIATRGDLTCIHFNFLSSIIPTWRFC